MNVEVPTSHHRTPRTDERRRVLFPSQNNDDSDSDLGHISPISFDSNHDDGPTTNLIQVDEDSIGDYHIIGIMEPDKLPSAKTTPISKATMFSDTMSPLYLSPYPHNVKSAARCMTEELSPSCNLKTPHDATCSSISKCKVPKLIRKSILDLNSDENCLKRKITPENSPESMSKVAKLDVKCRQALFVEDQEDLGVPVASFYPKVVAKVERKPRTMFRFNSPQTSSSGHRKSRTKRALGQINAGVKHSIRKPKPKKAKSSKRQPKLPPIQQEDVSSYLNELNDVLNNPKQIVKSNKENVGLSERKRALSPEPDLSKKFFKFPPSKSVVTVSKNLKVEVNEGKLAIVDQPTKKFKPSISFDASDLDPAPLLDQNALESIIDSLYQEPKTITLEAHNSVKASENSIMLHQVPSNPRTEQLKTQAQKDNILLSPTSQMCDMASGLAINSPKKAKNLTSVLNNMTNNNTFNQITSIVDNSKKMFPVFYPSAKSTAQVEKSSINRTKKMKISADQMLLDAGQKKFGLTECHTCGYFYHLGDPGDETMHDDYHNGSHVLKFQGWRNERVVGLYPNNIRVIQIIPHDSRYWWKKVKDLMELIDRELGSFDVSLDLNNHQAFLCVKNKSIVGCLTAVPKTQGYRMLSKSPNKADLCSETPIPIKCAVERIWVSKEARRQGVATCLMESLRINFQPNCKLTFDEIAFSSVTEMGRQFATKYFKTDNFLIDI